MKRIAAIACLAGLLGSAPLRATPAMPSPVTPAMAKQDIRCFMIFAAAVSNADKAGDEKARQGAGLGLMYFYAKLTVEVPGLNIAEAVRQQTHELTGNPRAREYGAACATEVQQRGQELMNIGEQLRKMGNAEAQSSSSS